MKYEIVGSTKDFEYEVAKEIILRHKGIVQAVFRPGVDNAFDDEATAKAVLDELKAEASLSKCSWGLRKKA